MYHSKIKNCIIFFLTSAISLKATNSFDAYDYRNSFSNSNFELFLDQSFLKKYKLKKFFFCQKNSLYEVQEYYLSDEVSNYVEEILEILQQNSINRKKIDWIEFRHKFYSKINGCAFIWETYSMMDKMLNQLEDRHSFFLKPTDLSQLREKENFFIEDLKGEFLQKNIAYLFIPGTLCTTGEYAQKLQDIIRNLDQKKPRKWIIDLRDNSGGNMWEILLGLAPFLEEGIQGFFGNHDINNLTSWVYEKGKVKLKNTTEDFEIGSLKSYYSIKRKNSKIVILINKKTSSSGEAVAIAFKGKKNICFFGSKTSGLTSGNATYILRDGSAIYLTECYFFDRNKHKYTDGVSPDKIITSYDNEEPLNSAIRYLNNQ